MLEVVPPTAPPRAYRLAAGNQPLSCLVFDPAVFTSSPLRPGLDAERLAPSLTAGVTLSINGSLYAVKFWSRAAWEDIAVADRPAIHAPSDEGNGYFALEPLPASQPA
jgi:hypothetical protein